MDINYRFSMTKIGIRATVGIGGLPFVAVRANMDAFPTQEVVEWEHKNKVVGKMYACGHDAHVAMLFGVARMLKAHEHHLKASLHFGPTPKCSQFAWSPWHTIPIAICSLLVS